MLPAAPVEKDLWRTAQNCHNDILPSVIVEIAESGSAARRRGGAAGIGTFEPAIVIHGQQWQLQIVKRRIDLLDVIQNMALRDKKILPARVVKILQANAPARASTGKHAQAGLKTAITECAVALVMVDPINFPGKFGHDHVGPAVVVIVLKNYSHAGESPSVL